MKKINYPLGENDVFFVSMKKKEDRKKTRNVQKKKKNRRKEKRQETKGKKKENFLAKVSNFLQSINENTPKGEFVLNSDYFYNSRGDIFAHILFVLRDEEYLFREETVRVWDLIVNISQTENIWIHRISGEKKHTQHYYYMFRVSFKGVEF